MQYIILCLLIFSLPALAGEPANNCHNQELNRQWEQALVDYSQDHLVLKLAAVRAELCGMIANGVVDLNTARTMWEQALTDALLEGAREQQAKRGLLKLFATF